ncbi:hypothetical protein H7I76_37470, partial [Mycolicibacterium vaccae]|nr:hypothetical protein [Mycolicibacterium vaccae]
LRRVYAPFDVAASGPPVPTGRVYTHEIPGGQLSNLRQQAIALVSASGSRTSRPTTLPRPHSGRLVKVTPSSKVGRDLA